MATGESTIETPAALTTVEIGTDKVDLSDITKCYTQREERIEVVVPIDDGRTVTLWFSPLPRRKEYDALIRQAKEFYETMPAINSAGFKNHPWHEFYPQDIQEFIEAYIIAELSIEPKIELTTTLVWLSNPNLVKSIIEQIEVGSKTVGQVWLASLTAAKKKSMRTVHEIVGSFEPASDEPIDSLAS